MAGDATFEDGKEAELGPASGGGAVRLCIEIEVFNAAVFKPVPAVIAVDTERRLVVMFATSL